MIADAGFRLSVMATAGLLAWANPLARRLRGVGGGRMPGWLAESLGISLAAQAATLPDVLATFGRLSLVSPAVNLAVVPLVPAAMLGGVVAMLAGAASLLGAPPLVATLAGLPGWIVLHVIVAIVRFARRRPVRRGDAAAGRRGGRCGRGRRRDPRRPGRRPRAPAPPPGTRAGVDASQPGRRPRARTPPLIGRSQRIGLAAAALVVAIVGPALGDAIQRDDAAHRPRRRAGRRDPARDADRRPDAGRRRPRPRSGPAGAGRADPAVGPAARHRGAHAPARGPRRGPGADPRALPRRTGLRARHARARPRMGGLGRGPPRRTAAWPPRDRRADPPRRGPAVGPVAGPGRRAARAARHRHGDQQRLGRVPGRGERPPLPADGRRRAGHRPDAARPRAPARRPGQDRPPRQRHGVDAGVRRRRPPASRDRLGRRRQPVRPPGAIDARPVPRERRARLPDGPGRLGRGGPPRRRPRRERVRAERGPRTATRASSASARPIADARNAAFLCAIPIPAGSPAWVAPGRARPRRRHPRRRPECAARRDWATAWAAPIGYDPVA